MALILATAILVASMVSVEAGISVALIELALGVLVGNAIDNITIPDWLSFVGSFAGIVLTIQGPLPAYAATIGEVEEVKREKDLFFGALGERARAEGERAGVAIELEIRAGHAAEAISSFAAEGGYDLVVLGHRGHFLRDHLLGSTADRVAEHAPCPVMIVR